MLGTDPADGEDVSALNGRYGPYVKKGNETRSLEHEDELFTIDLDRALALLAEPKRRRGQQRTAAAPLRELGTDPNSGEPVVVKEGRFGPYVTDGTTNASLRQGDTVTDITIERAVELLEERRAKGPTKKRAAKKRAAKKRPAKKTAKKATAKKATAKKSAAKKR